MVQKRHTEETLVNYSGFIQSYQIQKKIQISDISTFVSEFRGCVLRFYDDVVCEEMNRLAYLHLLRRLCWDFPLCCSLLIGHSVLERAQTMTSAGRRHHWKKLNLNVAKHDDVTFA